MTDRAAKPRGLAEEICEYFALLYQLATVGVVLLVIGQLISVWNLECDGQNPASGRS